MNVTFLGTAGSLQTAASGNTSFVVTQEGHSVLVDVSGSPGQNLQRVGLSCPQVDTVVLTHGHVDHLYALPSFLHHCWLQGRTKPLHLIGNEKTLSQARLLGDAFGLWDRDWNCSLTLTVLEDGSEPLADGLELHVFPVSHSAPTLGLRFTGSSGVLTYSADTEPDARLAAEAAGSDWLIHEAGNGLRDGRHGGHSSAAEAAAMAAATGAKALWLCHLEADSPGEQELHAAAAGAFSGRVIIPEPFVSYRLQDYA